MNEPNNTIDDGGPAFPLSRSHFTPEGKMLSADWVGGMTLRDYFAAQAFGAVIGNGKNMGQLTPLQQRETFDAAAELIYAAADAMIRARKTSKTT
jgi:hypothetical protein